MHIKRLIFKTFLNVFRLLLKIFLTQSAVIVICDACAYGCIYYCVLFIYLRVNISVMAATSGCMQYGYSLLLQPVSAVVYQRVLL